MIIIVIGNSLFVRTPGHLLNWIAALVWPIGWLAYRFKQYNSKYYGTVEILFGVLAAFGITIRGKFSLAEVIATFGSMYVVSRGYSNIADAEKRKDEIAKNAQAFRDYRGRVRYALNNLWATLRGKRVDSINKHFQQK